MYARARLARLVGGVGTLLVEYETRDTGFPSCVWDSPLDDDLSPSGSKAHDTCQQPPHG